MRKSSSKYLHRILLTAVLAINFLLLWAGWSAVLHGSNWFAQSLRAILPFSLSVTSHLFGALSLVFAFVGIGLMSWLCRNGDAPKSNAQGLNRGGSTDEQLAPSNDTPFVIPGYAKRTMVIAAVALCVVTVMTVIECVGLGNGAPAKEYAEQADLVSQEVASLARMLFAEEAPRDENVRQFLVFSSDEEMFSSAMHARFPELARFRYSLIGLLLRSHRKQLQFLKDGYQLVMTWRYQGKSQGDFPIPYVLVTPKHDATDAATCELVFAIEPDTGRLLLDGSSINGASFLDFLSVMRTGEFTRKQAEYAFLEHIQPLLASKSEQP